MTHQQAITTVALYCFSPFSNSCCAMSSSKSNDKKKSIDKVQPPPSTRSEPSTGEENKIHKESNREEQELDFNETNVVAKMPEIGEKTPCKCDDDCGVKVDPSKSHKRIFPNLSEENTPVMAPKGTSSLCTCKRSIASSVSCPSNSGSKSTSSIDTHSEVQICQSKQKLYCGLINIGQTSYENAVLQMLFNWCQFKTRLLKNALHQDGLCQSLSALFLMMDTAAAGQNMDSVKFASVAPMQFLADFQKLCPKHEKCDAQEFLSTLLVTLHQEMNQVCKLSPEEMLDKPAPTSANNAWQLHVKHYDQSFLSQCLMSQLQSMVTCCKCGHQSLSWNFQWHLPLQLGSSEPVADQSKSLTLNDCLFDYLKGEVIPINCRIYKFE